MDINNGKGISVLSLFDGMSCGQVALERVGIEVDKYFACEIDKYAMQITQKNFPNTIQLGDVVNIKGEELPKIDLLIGGSPCQGFSFAGKKLNFEDSRSKLFFEYVRILKEVKPRYFLLENVKMKKEYQDIITDYLGVEPIKINSSLFSAQNRERIYWTNITGIELPNSKNIVLKDILEKEVEDKYYMDKPLIFKENKIKSELKHIANIPKEFLNDNERQRRIYDITGKSPSLLARSDSPKILVVGNLEMKASNQIKQVLSIEGLCSTVDTAQGGHRQPKVLINNRVRKLTPLECERLQTLDDNYTEGVSNTQRYKMIGNGWTVDVIAYIFGHIQTF